MIRAQIAVVVVCLAFPVAAIAVEEEISDFEELDLEELLDVVFSASKHRQSIFWSPSAASVYTREDIRSSGATTLADFLRRVPGFDVYSVKPSYPLVGARALTTASNNRVLVLVDGREALVEVTGFAFWDFLTVDLEEVERIEVIRGPGSALYGANAFAAVVNITTVADNPPSGAEIFLKAGEEGRERLFGRARHTFGLGAGTLSFGAGLGVEEMRSPTDIQAALSQILRAHGYLRYREGRDLDLSLHAGIIVGDGVIYIQLGDMRFTDGANYWVMGKSEIGLGEKIRLKSQLYYTNYTGDFIFRTELRAYDIFIASAPVMSVSVDTVDGQVQLDWDLTDNLMCISGANLRYNHLNTVNVYASEKDELRAAGFVNIQWSPFEMFQLTGGLRLDTDTSTDELTFSPRVAAVLRPWETQAFRLGYSLAFRRPSYFENRMHVRIENYNPATPEIVDLLRSQYGNEDVGNEQVHSLEAGWRGRFFDDRLQLSADLFFSRYRDTITFVINVPERLGLPDIASSTVQYQNQGAEVDAVGGEAEVVLRPTGNWTFWSNLGVRKVINIDTDEDMPSEPQWRINLGGRYLPASGLLADVALHYVSTYLMPLIDPSNLLNEPRTVALGDRLLLFARLGYRIKLDQVREIESGLAVRTPLGNPFREYPGAPLPLTIQTAGRSDFGGEYLARLISFYLRGSF
ncbi:TonB-dependent receptor plug domain-containing protein [Myxococcota bacterium]